MKISKYVEALNLEITHQKDNRVNQHKVINGKRISRTADYSIYIFDLQTDMHLSDDAPIKLQIGSDEIHGTALMCDESQILLKLKTDKYGESIGSAYLSAEPWKLLEDLRDRVVSRVKTNPTKTSKTIAEKGPQLATDRAIDDILKGQQAAIKHAIEEPVTIVWGPPGTGKTTVMSALAIYFLSQNKKVLIVSHSNVSVDGVAKKIYQQLRASHGDSYLEKGKVLRYGYIRDEELHRNEYISSLYHTISKHTEKREELDALQDAFNKLKKQNGLGDLRVLDLKKRIMHIQAEMHAEESKYVRDANVVCTTASKMVSDKTISDEMYDVVMFDEVSMAYAIQVLAAATFSKEKLICVGDFMQLPAIAQGPKKDVLCEDIFDYLGINRNGEPYYHPWLVMLDEQHRMHPDISAFSSKYVYKGLLRDAEGVEEKRKEIVDSEMFMGDVLKLIDMEGTYCACAKSADNSRYNILSALISFAISLKSEVDGKSVSIITPYSAQTLLVRKLILDYREKKKTTEITCATVHQFQGSESDMVLFDAVESYPGKGVGQLMTGDLNRVKRLINVAVTRAKGKFVTVANRKFWNNALLAPSHIYLKLMNHIADKNGVIKHPDEHTLDKLLTQLSVDGGPEFFLDSDKYIDLLCKDIENAKEKIVISLPSANLDLETAEKVLNSIKKAANVKVISKCKTPDALPEEWRDFTCECEEAIFPIILIDDHIFWYGVPQAKWPMNAGATVVAVTVCYVACRVDGNHTTEQVKAMAELEYATIDKKSRRIKGVILNDETIRNSNLKPESDTMSLKKYVASNCKCDKCGQSLTMFESSKGKTLLKCEFCNEISFLTPEIVKSYIEKNDVKCPNHNCRYKSGVSRFGIYVRCPGDGGHFVKPMDI